MLSIYTREVLNILNCIQKISIRYFRVSLKQLEYFKKKKKVKMDEENIIKYMDNLSLKEDTSQNANNLSNTQDAEKNKQIIIIKKKKQRNK